MSRSLDWKPIPTTEELVELEIVYSNAWMDNNSRESRGRNALRNVLAALRDRLKADGHDFEADYITRIISTEPQQEKRA